PAQPAGRRRRQRRCRRPDAVCGGAGQCPGGQGAGLRGQPTHADRAAPGPRCTLPAGQGQPDACV
nr:hypothetical protein [Tanacetum cinerariifolium]